MGYLLVVSLIWAFSFGLIKDNLSGLDPSFVSFARMALSLIFFAPFLSVKGLRARPATQLVLLGAVQYGLMYVLYIASFAHLAAHQVVLFTVFTPIFVVILDDLWERRFRPSFLLAALLAVGGAMVVGGGPNATAEMWRGFLLVQGSNLCFAIGQVWYRRLDLGGEPQRGTFALAYLGAVVVTAGGTVITPGAWPATLTFTHIWTLTYLGIVASGIGFFLWNVGATKTNAGVLAAFNNAKIPLGVAVSLLVFGEDGDVFRLALGGVLLACALWIAHRMTHKGAQKQQKER